MTVVFRYLDFLFSSTEKNKVILYCLRADHPWILVLCAYHILFNIYYENIQLKNAPCLFHTFKFHHFFALLIFVFLFSCYPHYPSSLYSRYISLIYVKNKLLLHTHLAICDRLVSQRHLPLQGWLDTLLGTLKTDFLATVMEGRNSEIISSKHWWKTMVYL